MKRLRIGVGVGLLLVLFSCAGRGAGGTVAEGTALSADGVPIHYRVAGSGDVALVFLHGWMGDARWWDVQVAHFAPRYRVVAIDLAGHGQSGRGRKAWTVAAFARDVRAVADRLRFVFRDEGGPTLDQEMADSVTAAQQDYLRSDEKGSAMDGEMTVYDPPRVRFLLGGSVAL